MTICLVSPDELAAESTETKLTASDAAAGDVFGDSVAISGDTVVVGAPGAFELANGLDPLDPADASEDADGDGFTNLEEFRGGSDPNDARSDPSPKAKPWLLLLDD